MVYGVLCHFQQYFSYIMAVSFIGGGNQGTQRKTPTCPSHGQPLSQNVVSTQVHFTMNGVWTHNLSGDRHWLHS